ncbi:MAG: hypothetical protein Ct9H300mP25_17120 [Acidobacteriota bacterium]|nr:MAG: hypothetical protein Ct9H300mP25_17120 [Acidobacteriota bacterium]
MIISALESTGLALKKWAQRRTNHHFLKVSRPRDLIIFFRALRHKRPQPLHLGLTEAGMGPFKRAPLKVGSGPWAHF